MEQRIEEVEIKLTLMEQTVDELNAVITRQDALIQQLTARLERIEQQAAEANTGAPGELGEAVEIPPHY